MGLLTLLLLACVVDECAPVDPEPTPEATFSDLDRSTLPGIVSAVALTADTVVLTVDGADGPYEVVYRRPPAD